MSARYRYIWTAFTRLRSNCKFVSQAIHKETLKCPVPCILGFSIFTWLGFEKKLNTEDELIQTIKHCVLFIQRTEYEKAEQLLHVALRQAQQVQHLMGITYIYDVMANLALEREQLDKAKKLFVAVTQRIMADGATEDDLRVIQISTKLARISHLKKEYTTAQLGYDWCIDKLNNIVKNNPNEEVIKLLALTEDWYGRLFLDCNQAENGLNLMISSLDKMRGVSDVEKEHIVIQLNDIGTVCDSIDKIDESIKYFKEAIELGKSLNMNELGAMYVNLGRVYLRKNMLNEARKNCGFGWKLGVLEQNDDIKKEAELCIKQIKSIN
ncbi:hypothetical protein K1T71_010271 [Dendrolimus kikuchii]|uniref:Uncharacterized protein n=1 Tax=Dendrolimus kikuchii TaxID=765133 RepID=A0ACC1CRS3_9NEOP|nr:hypothetical protein K1T71_010271 [Dendrolimus kikuchii]